MAIGVFRVPRHFPIQEPLQLNQVVHSQPIEITPAGYSEEVVDHDGGISFAGQTFLANQLFSGFFGVVMIIVSIKQFHSRFL